MLHILLLILKIIGIILLAILGALLLGIICALFVPVRYRIEAVRREGGEEPPVRIRVKVTWLFHLINFLLRFDGEIFVRLRLLLFTILRLPKKERRRKKAEKGEKKQEQKKQEKIAPPIDKAEDGQPTEAATKDDESQESGALGADAGDEVGTTETDDVSEERAEEAEPDDIFLEEEKDREEDKTESVQEKPGFSDKLRAILEILRKLFEKIRGFFENIQYTSNRFCDKIRSVSETIEYYREVVEGEPFRRSFALCKKELTGIIKSVKPRKFEVSLIVGMDDPASTGEILAVCGMLYPIIGGHVDVRGDFENKRLEGQVLIVGKLRMATFLRTAVKVYFNKDIRKLYKLLKKEAVNG